MIFIASLEYGENRILLGASESLSVLVEIVNREINNPDMCAYAAEGLVFQTVDSTGTAKGQRQCFVSLVESGWKEATTDDGIGYTEIQFEPITVDTVMRELSEQENLL